MNLLPATSQATNLKKYLLLALILIILISTFTFYFNYRSSLKEELTSLKLTEQQLSGQEKMAEQSTFNSPNWSGLLGKIPIDMEKVSISNITKNADALIVTGEAVNFLAVTELAIMINNDNNELINSVKILNIEKIREEETTNFEISILLTQ